ncbi:rod shape-determining protein [Candidatus Beckwithbacteria bacterium CG2_30_44_31]|uniref:Cell shape-determining protein MreB n=1 Tax=Candidatus Beckwithbacteria bacterium CG2_30_44_31 TaxID=1805035 RepID=A0A1J5BB25_9BACT|nr:MAG: rod shape-determining protein [Candidatus Beckwithbacteria bacterium CG2_30_44_31]
MRSLIRKIGIDLGTANSVVYAETKGIVLQEPTVVAVTVEDNKVVAVGSEAKEMLGRTPGSIMASRPMRNGVIADYVVTEAMLRYFIQKVCGRNWLFRPEVMICVPAGCTQVERRAVEEATEAAGAKEVYIIQEPFAAALGAGVAVGEASGNMIVDMGGGSAEAAVISLGGVVVSKSLRISGNALDDAIAAYLRKKHSLIVGEQTAEEIKISIGRALATETDNLKPMLVKGRDSIQGLPKTVEVSAEEIEEAIRPKLMQIVNMVKSVLEEVPPELASDIIDKGIVMSGGTSLLKNLDKLLTKETGVPCHVAEEPMLCVAKGTGIALDNLDLYKRAISKR